MGDSGISWIICISFAPRSTQITTPVPHHSVLQDAFLPPNQQRQSTEGNVLQQFSFRSGGVGWSLTSLFSTNMAISETIRSGGRNLGTLANPGTPGKRPCGGGFPTEMHGPRCTDGLSHYRTLHDALRVHHLLLLASYWTC